MLVGWLDTEDVRSQWLDAPVNDDELADLLKAAWEQCAAYAPEAVGITTGAVVLASVPASYKRAQLMQARALYRALIAGSNDQLGSGEFGVTVFPMDWTVKNLLRPKRGFPVLA